MTWFFALFGLGVLIMGFSVVADRLDRLVKTVNAMDDALREALEEVQGTLRSIEDDVSAMRSAREPEEDWDKYGVGMAGDDTEK